MPAGSPTEDVNPRTRDLDLLTTSDLVRVLHAEDELVPRAVAAVLDDLAAVVDIAAERVRAGGRVHYFGAGTSGRLAVLDAAELVPTFGIESDLVIAHQAGGSSALVTAVENAEDDETAAARDAAGVSSGDLVIGLAASGRTPYVATALTVARAAGAVTVLVTSNPSPSIAADHLLVVDTGPEAITGSTRLKAGTAQKLVLNTFSTALMVRLGRTYGNLMIDVRPTNAKLRGRVIALLVQATGRSADDCAAALSACGDLRTALVHLLSPGEPDPLQARAALDAAGGDVRVALRHGAG